MPSLRTLKTTGTSSPISSQRSPASPRWATPRTAGRKTLAIPAAENIAAKLGMPLPNGDALMPWQQQVLEAALEINPATGRLAYRQVVLTVPRQSGKTTLLLVLVLLRALAAKRQNLRYTAQTGSDARKKFVDDWRPVLEASPFSSQFKIRLTNGHEAMLFKNGSHFGLVATTKKTGHGGTIDLGILDEAFAHPDARLEQALGPAMITRPQPQLWVVSTAGTPEDSPYLWGKVETGRQLAEAGVNEGIAYFEWSAHEDADPGDPETWWSCMPALGITATEQAVAAEFASMSLSEFRRAYLNQWVTALSDPVIPLDKWKTLVDADSEMRNPICFAFDVTPDRQRSAIAAAGRRPDGLLHVEVVDARSGTGWLAGAMGDLVKNHKPQAVLCDPGGPAGSLLPDMVAAGVEVTTVTPQEHAKACGSLFDAAMQAQLRHLGTLDLLSALDGAVKRPLSDAWLWSRKSSSVDISPLVAITLALWGVTSQPPPKKARVVDLAAALQEAAEAERQALVESK